MNKIANFIKQSSKFIVGFEKEFNERNEGALALESLFHKYDVAVNDFVSNTKYGIKYIDKLKNVSFMTNQDNNMLNELERHIYEFSLDDDENNDWVKIFVDNDPVYIKKVDLTHLYFNRKEPKEGIALHVAQLDDNKILYNDLVQWLHGRLKISDKKYK